MPEFNLRVYPRGFLGTQLPPKPIKDNSDYRQVDQSMRSVVIGLTTQEDVLVGHPSVMKMISEVLANNIGADTFSYHEKILLIALNVFGTRDFETWYKVQVASPYFGDMHSRFMDDTFNFILTGHRDMDVMTWSRILTFETQTEVKHKASKTSSMFFDYLKEQGGSRLENVIHKWVSQPGGIVDLALSLHVMFGDH